MVLNEAFRLLGTNKVVEVLYCQNLEDGMTDDTLRTLIDVLKKGRIWALNVGENYRITNSSTGYLGVVSVRTFFGVFCFVSIIRVFHTYNRLKKTV